ncbi:hybrid sensor histidine kinase/response regulator [[Limnothrix rosea] IAM M-220]|uniref:hybrid sensor histidine kinase/response regulator n=1 Tax=[Limnothrix rosea] IAM M-220 TaxID=454133 RepID=UPI00095CC7C2|nr:hybrid sensor histidine kinase/response regulator [[Limnothrix rosea] IAM M-220]OKH19218.1 hybrid sensor histidine kinase/response regulator [[Limnothrix rosea] IAM M-220]
MLDAASLKAIALEARHCFLLEDAPDFITLFYGSIKQLKNELAQPTGANIGGLYKDLVRSAHSIKGGAGLAELTPLNQLAHKMEDLLEAMAEGRVQDQTTGLELVTLAMEEVQNCVDLAASSDDNPGMSSGVTELTKALEEFIEASVAPETSPDMAIGSSTPSQFIITSLRVDLEACVKRLEDLLVNRPTAQRLKSHLTTLAEECQLLGEALSLPWLQDISLVITQMTAKPIMPLPEFAALAIAEIRAVSQAYLQDVENTDLSPTFKQFQEAPKVTAPPEPPTAPVPAPVATTAPTTTATTQKKTSTLQVRMPITQLNRMGNAVGELFIGYEQLSRHQQQLLQASRNLKQRTQQLNPIRDEVVTLYDQLAIASPKITTPNGNGHNQNTSPEAAAILGEASPDSEFDSLHFDQYTQAHSNLQQFQELMVQVQEIREDIELIRWEFQNSLDSMRQQLEYLNQDLTQSRLVPFGKLARRFIQSLETLSQRYPQSAQLKIVGEDVLVDQAILEQLRTPLTHLIRNAFDHGIEPPVQRRQGDKPETGTITLSAKLLGNIVEIEVSDDGKGVSVDRVWEKAVAVGLHSPTERDRLSENQILDFIFAPGFSTRQKVSDLSGRGMGLDIVRLELDQLNGTVSVDSREGQGTKFTIRIPLSFNILPLLLCRCQQQVLALPSVNISGVVALVGKNATAEPPDHLDWQGSPLKLHPLDELLPYTQSNVFLPPDQRPKPTIAVVVRQGDQPLAITVDEIIGERELVLKALDRTVTYPPYIAGCTVLGTGEVVPVLIPDAFDHLLNAPKLDKLTTPPPTVAQNVQRQPSILIIDDSVAVRRTLNKMLTQCGYQVHQCRDGKEAWNFLNRSNQTFDLAICDLEMPGYDGFTLLQMVRGQQQWDSLPFVMLTSRDNDLHRQRAERLGASNYFTKPFNPIQFLQAIAEYVD